jgi:hypothetical protein
MMSGNCHWKPIEWQGALIQELEDKDDQGSPVAGLRSTILVDSGSVDIIIKKGLRP